MRILLLFSSIADTGQPPYDPKGTAAALQLAMPQSWSTSRGVVSRLGLRIQHSPLHLHFIILSLSAPPKKKKIKKTVISSVSTWRWRPTAGSSSDPSAPSSPGSSDAPSASQQDRHSKIFKTIFAFFFLHIYWIMRTYKKWNLHWYGVK